MRAHTQPMLISQMGTSVQSCVALERLPFRIGAGAGEYNEAWLQKLIQDHPGLLPVADIEPGLVPLVPICTELPVPSGYIDNLMVTPDGGIIVVETKLWRNAEARREVLGQVLDYAKDLTGFSYETFERAIGVALKNKSFRLFDLVASNNPDLDEARFIDAVSRNLKHGRMLLIVAGDGIQEGAEQLTDFLQRHVGLHCTISLVEVSLWRSPKDGSIFVQPRILAKTVQIERAVVRVEDGVKLSLPAIETVGPAKSRATTLSEEQFYALLGQVDPMLPGRLADFMAKASDIGVFAQVGRTFALKWRAPGGENFHLGSIDLSGNVATDYCNWVVDQLGRLDLSHGYLADVAALLPDGWVKQTEKEVGWRVVTKRGEPRLAELLDHADSWLEVISHYTAKLSEFLQS